MDRYKSINERYNPENEFINFPEMKQPEQKEPPVEQQQENSDERRFKLHEFHRLWGVILSVVVLVLLFGLSQSWQKETSLSEVIINGCEVLNRDSLQNEFSQLLGKRLTDINLEEIEDKMKRIGYIKEVVATKELPNRIRLHIKERVPVAFTILNHNIYVIDEEGMLLEYRRESFKDKNLPMISGIRNIKTLENGVKQIKQSQIVEAIQLVKALNETELAKSIIGEINIEQANMMFARTSQGKAKLIFGDDGGYGELLKKFEAFWVNVVTEKGFKNYSYIDLRFKDKVFVKEI